MKISLKNKKRNIAALDISVQKSWLLLYSNTKNKFVDNFILEEPKFQFGFLSLHGQQSFLIKYKCNFMEEYENKALLFY